MDHEAVIEAIELAALEPGGLDRLMAGDTATSQVVAAHLAGCSPCGAELAAIGRSSLVIADVVASTPPADLRARTLASVRERGIPRGVSVAASTPVDMPASAPVLAAVAPGTTSGPRRGPVLGWVAAIAATLILSVAATSIVVGDRSQVELATQAATIDALQDVTLATLAVAAEPDATSVALTGTADPATTGSILFSPSSTELVVVATGLIEPPSAQEYACWMDAGSGRVRVGKMFFGGGLAYWAGESDAIAGLDGPAAFGVSLVGVGSPVMDSAPVLLGKS